MSKKYIGSISKSRGKVFTALKNNIIVFFKELMMKKLLLNCEVCGIETGYLKVPFKTARSIGYDPRNAGYTSLCSDHDGKAFSSALTSKRV